MASTIESKESLVERVNELSGRNDQLETVARAALDLFRNTDRFVKQGDPNWENLSEALHEADLFTCAD